MKVITANSDVIELGTVEASPTIGITDYSRRVTDDFGVTTVVQRGFARRMSVRLGIPFDTVDEIERQLADLRATPATWIADDRYASLSVRGFYKDFEVDLAMPSLSYCTLSVEGLAETAAFVDGGGDPATDGNTSTLKVLQPVLIDDSVLKASSVAVSDAPAWLAGSTYAAGARIIKASTHRIYESVASGNVGNDPGGTSGKWLDVGPTNRWAMFDQALGTSTIVDTAIELTLAPTVATSALALLDTNAASIRVRSPGYDRTQAPNSAGKVLFLDLAVAAGASIMVTITPATSAGADRRWDDGAAWMDEGTWRDSIAAGDGTVTIGTFLLGAIKGLGVTEASPTAGITDYSRKVTDDFGEVTLVPRAWAKRMSAKALIRTGALDLVVGRLAAVRALPSLWIGQEGLDSLTVYGFFKDFSIEVGETVSKLSLSIEGLSTAGKVAPLGTGVNWPDIADPTGTKPTDNADKTSDNTSKDTAAVGGKPSSDVLNAIDAAKARQDQLENQTIPAINNAVAAANAAIANAQQAADAAVADANARIAASRSLLDQAVANLAAEVSRAQGEDEQLSQRIDSIVAEGGNNDTQVRALIQSVDTARADDKRAIGQRVDAVIADYHGLDGATNTRISQTNTAYSDADAAIGQRIDAVVIDYHGLNSTTNTRITNQVAALSDADSALGQRIDSIVADGGYDDTYVRSEISRVDNAAVTRDGALGQRIDTVTTEYRGLDSTTNTRLTNISTASSNADQALGSRIDTVTADYQGRDAATNARVTATNQAFADADTALANRSSAIEASLNGPGGAFARIAGTEAAITDGRFATAQRASNIEASVGQVSARVSSTESAVSDGRFAAASTLNQLRSEYNGTVATVTQQAGTIAGLGQKAAAYVKIVADAGNGRAGLSLWSDEHGGSWSLTGDGIIDNNVVFKGVLSIGVGGSGARTVITSDRYEVYDTNNVLRVRLGLF